MPTKGGGRGLRSGSSSRQTSAAKAVGKGARGVSGTSAGRAIGKSVKGSTRSSGKMVAKGRNGSPSGGK